MDQTYFKEKVATQCYQLYDKLPKSGKPNPKTEWTVLCCILKTESENMNVVSLGTGSKCIGMKEMSATGDILNDSHAEVMARRGFLRYLYEQIENAFNSKNSIFNVNDSGKCMLKDDIKFHLFISQSPCGDISNIISPCTTDINSTSEEAMSFKRLKVDEQRFINISGAKSLGNDNSSRIPKLGQPATKPGKGDPTGSMSCSDKVARWLSVGFQGALLYMLLDRPITVHSITIGGDTPFCIGAFYRCLVDRTFEGTACKNDWDILRKVKCQPLSGLLVVPYIYQSVLSFKHAKCKDRRPSPSSIVWCDVKEVPLEVAVAGRKQGVTKKCVSNDASSLLISKRKLFERFLHLIAKKKNLLFEFEMPNDPTYKNYKALAVHYYIKWNFIQKEVFRIWTNKPNLNDFKLSIQQT